MKTKKIVIIGIVGLLIGSGVLAGAYYLYFPYLRLPGQPVTMTAYNGVASYFDIYLSDVPKGFDVINGYYVGWCADQSVRMPRGEAVTVRLYNSYDLLLPLPLRDKNWDKVNYILNHKGTATKMDMQGAFWHLLDGYSYEKISSTAQMLVDTAQEGFMPQPGDFIAILAEPINDGRGTFPFQFAFLQVRLPPHEGLSHGYWKNHVNNWPSGYTPAMLVDDVFVNASLYVSSTDTLLDALNYDGGDGEVGGAQILLRNAVASVLNARHPQINYPVLEADLIAEVNEALGSHNRTIMLDLEAILNVYNNLGADLTQHDVNYL